MNRAALTRSAAVASIGTAMLLLVLKLWAAMQTHSTAMLGSLADTALDLVASIATLAGVWIAALTADEDHRFGHGKAETLAPMHSAARRVGHGCVGTCRSRWAQDNYKKKY